MAGPRPIKRGTSAAFGSVGDCGGSNSGLRGDFQAQSAVRNTSTPRAVAASFHDIHCAYKGDDGSIIGMKACNPDFNQFARVIGLTGDRISVMSGEEPFFATHVAMGARGGVLATANVFPKIWQEIFALASAGNLKGALARQQQILPLLDATFSETNPGPLKELMAMMGQPVGHVLRPLQRPRPETMEKLQAAVRTLQAT